MAGKLYDIPVLGTHAHSWVTAFDSELEAFTAYVDVMPHNCVLLVDTYDTIEGVKHAITVGKKLREDGAELLAIRLDSGNLAELSIKARKLLDQAGFEKTGIIASNSLDEYVIDRLKKQDAKMTSWGVGTNLTTVFDQPALDGVYKLSALQKSPQADWEYKLKLSEDPIKISNPGRHQVRRFFYENQYVMDVIYDLDLGISDTPEVVIIDTQQVKKLDDIDAFVDLLQPIFDQGKLIQEQSSLHTLRKNALEERKLFDKTHAQQVYPIALEKKLYELKQKLILDIRQAKN